MKIAIIICATSKYAYAMKVGARRIQAAVHYAKLQNEEGFIILVGDKSETLDPIKDAYEKLLPNWKTEVLKLDIDDGHKNYKEAAQITIATMRSTGFSRARSLEVDYCFSNDSDVLIGVSSLKCALDILNFDYGYYSIACPLYSTQGGPGAFLCGHGTPERPIASDFSMDERKIPKRYLDFRRKYDKELKRLKPTRENAETFIKHRKKLVWIDKRIERYPPKANVFTLNGIQWRRRGWFDYAYPAIGKGAIVPSDWCGFGATMMNRKALELALFDGYDGRGTEDLYVCFNRWYPAGLRIAAIPHSLCDHVVRDRHNPNGEKPRYLHIQAYHEDKGECKDHLRQRVRPFYTMEEGDKFEVDRSGNIIELKPATKRE